MINYKKKYYKYKIKYLNCEKNQQGGNGNTFDENTLTQYLNYSALFGPTGINMYELNGKTIIFFNDLHVAPDILCESIKKNTENIVWIDKFLKELFLKSTVCIDFF